MWLSIIGLLLSPLTTITKQIADARVAMANSRTEQERIAAEERVKMLEAKRDVLIAESKTPWNAIARFFLMTPVGVYLWLLFVWDKGVCKWFSTATQHSSVCSTDPLSPWLTGIAGMIIGFYFLTDMTKILKR